ncbi:MAG TPA: type III PLP-dependent enzyme [Amnibacterium sp.]|jgi:ornithine decarboxylase|uniref:type III PLP-dependent enzyme n=1 Tax=Amnibacterium sp. TaxID=1872496 RepID=UPI002F91F5B9
MTTSPVALSASNERPRTLGRLLTSARFWVVRYLPCELAGTVLLLTAGLLTLQRTGSVLGTAVAGTIAESIGFYAVAFVLILLEQRRVVPDGGWRLLSRTVGLGVAEFGPVELLDTLLARPALLFVGVTLLPNPAVGLVAGKIAADVLFYVGAATAYRLTELAGWRTPRVPADADAVAAAAEPVAPAMRELRRRQLAERYAHTDLAAAHDRAGGPVLVLDTGVVRERYRALRAALPGVRLHYAVKALDHPAVLAAVAEEDGCFDVASEPELRAVLDAGVSGDQILFSNPIATFVERFAAMSAGVRTFVVDNHVELLKARDLPSDCAVLIRLAVDNPDAHIDLSTKFGADRRTAERLVATAVAQGVNVAGFSFHVGSQSTSVAPFRQAIADTLQLMALLETRHGIRFTVLDIGGGFPASYRDLEPSAVEIAAAIRPLLEPLAGRVTVLAEPGRCIVADAMTAVAAVVGVADRPDGRWYYLDDGLYGSYSNVMTEDVHPLLIAGRELDQPMGEPSWVTLAGPTCDSADVIARRYPMPELHVGDLVIAPTMGAYTTVTASRFNGRPPATIVPARSVAAATVR